MKFTILSILGSAAAIRISAPAAGNAGTTNPIDIADALPMCKRTKDPHNHPCNALAQQPEAFPLCAQGVESTLAAPCQAQAPANHLTTGNGFHGLTQVNPNVTPRCKDNGDVPCIAQINAQSPDLNNCNVNADKPWAGDCKPHVAEPKSLSQSPDLNNCNVNADKPWAGDCKPHVAEPKSLVQQWPPALACANGGQSQGATDCQPKSLAQSPDLNNCNVNADKPWAGDCKPHVAEPKSLVQQWPPALACANGGQSQGATDCQPKSLVQAAPACAENQVSTAKKPCTLAQSPDLNNCNVNADKPWSGDCKPHALNQAAPACAEGQVSTAKKPCTL